MIDIVFAWCVQILVWLARLLSISYETINVWIFVIIWPIFTLLLIGTVIFQRCKIRQLKSKASDKGAT